MDNRNYTYWARTHVGVEEIALNEMREKLEIENFNVGHRNLFFSTKDNIEGLVFKDKLRVVDDLYRLVGVFDGVGNTKKDLDPFFEYFQESMLSKLENLVKDNKIKVTASFVGKRNFNRVFLESGINEVIKSQSSLVLLENEDDRKNNHALTVRCHIDGENVYVGLSFLDHPLHRREWRSGAYLAQLPPTIAATLIRLANIEKDEEIIDPFCGSGTILIEAKIANSNQVASGYDINPKAIDVAIKNARAAKKEIDFYLKNSLEKICQDDYKDKVLITNPPWGDKHSTLDYSLVEYVDRLSQIINMAKRTVLVAVPELIEYLEQSGVLFGKKITTRINGKIAVIASNK